jgi:hypothetical protein
LPPSQGLAIHAVFFIDTLFAAGLQGHEREGGAVRDLSQQLKDIRRLYAKR